MKIVVLSANLFWLNLIKYILGNKLFKIDTLITLDNNSTTIMYDWVEKNIFKSLLIKNKYFIDRIENEEKLIKKINPDLIIVAWWRQIIPNYILSIPKYHFIWFHPTKLPQWRWWAPIINSILNNYTNSWVTLFKYTDQVDEWDIVFQEDFIINDTDYSKDIYTKMTISSFKILEKLWESIKYNKIIFYPQKKEGVTYFDKINYKDNFIDDFSNSFNFMKKVRAFSIPYKWAYLFINKIKIILFDLKIDNWNCFIINNVKIENIDKITTIIENKDIKIIILDYININYNTIKITSGYLYLKINYEK